MAPRPARTARTLNELQTLLDAFTSLYNHHRPHRSLPHQATPATAYTARPKATPATGPPTPTTASAPTASTPTASSPCASTADSTTSASAEPTPGTPVLLLIHDLHVRVINAATGELLRDLIIDPARTTSPPAATRPKQKHPEP